MHLAVTNEQTYVVSFEMQSTTEGNNNKEEEHQQQQGQLTSISQYTTITNNK